MGLETVDFSRGVDKLGRLAATGPHHQRETATGPPVPSVKAKVPPAACPGATGPHDTGPRFSPRDKPPRASARFPRESIPWRKGREEDRSFEPSRARDRAPVVVVRARVGSGLVPEGAETIRFREPSGRKRRTPPKGWPHASSRPAPARRRSRSSADHSLEDEDRWMEARSAVLPPAEWKRGFPGRFGFASDVDLPVGDVADRDVPTTPGPG